MDFHVTVDALNPQKDRAAEIRNQRADYVLALQGNHSTWLKAAEASCKAVTEVDPLEFTSARSKRELGSTLEEAQGRSENQAPQSRTR